MIMKRLLIFAVGMIGLFLMPTSCERESIYEKEAQPYLSLEGGNDLSSKDRNVLAQAFLRANIRLEKGEYQFSAQSGTELNISEELFEKLQEVVRNSNERRLSKVVKSFIPRLKSNTENPGGSSDTTSTDCVAHVVSTVLGNFGVAMSHLDINSWIVDEYGPGGVPANNFYDVLDQFLGGSSASLPNSYFYTGSGPQLIVVISTGNPNEGHAVTVTAVDGNNNNILVHDPQMTYEHPTSDPQGYIVSMSDVLFVYEANDAL